MRCLPLLGVWLADGRKQQGIGPAVMGPADRVQMTGAKPVVCQGTGKP